MSFTGKGQVFVKALNNMSVNGVDYTKDEVVCYFNNAEFNIGFGIDTSNAAIQNKILLSNSGKNAQSVLINVAGLKTGVWRLIGTKLATTSAAKPVAIKVISDATGNVYLPASGTVTNLTMSNADTLLKYETFTGPTQGLVQGLDATTTYIAMYNEELDFKVAHTLTADSIPYLYIEFIQENSEGSVLIKVPKVALATAPNFNFSSDSLINIPLSFYIINSEIEIYEYE